MKSTSDNTHFAVVREIMCYIRIVKPTFLGKFNADFKKKGNNLIVQSFTL